MRQLSTIEVWGITKTTTVDLSDDPALKTIASYRNIEASEDIDLDASLVPGLLTSNQRTELEHSTQEIQLLANALDNKLEWVTGLYWYYEDGVEHSPGGRLPGSQSRTPLLFHPETFHSNSGHSRDGTPTAPSRLTTTGTPRSFRRPGRYSPRDCPHKYGKKS